jgi:hypothetical protein
MASRLSRSGSLLFLCIACAAGCGKRYDDTRIEGAFTIVEHWYESVLNWEASGVRVESCTIGSSYGEIRISDGQVDDAEDRRLLVADWQERGLVLLLDKQTGRAARCVDCTCPARDTPFGPAIAGWRDDADRSKPAPIRVYGGTRGAQDGDREATSLCVLDLRGDGTYRARALTWPSAFPYRRDARRADDGTMMAIGCRENSDVATCALFVLAEGKPPRTLRQARVDDAFDLMVRFRANGPAMARGYCDGSRPCEVP